MPLNLVTERFPVVVPDGDSFVTQYMPVRTLLDGAENMLFAANASVTRVVISCHGRGADAHAYADNGHHAATLAGVASETLVVAPQFANRDDLFPGQLEAAPNVLYWGGGRFWGRRSRDEPIARPVRVSSFTVIDQLIAHVAESGLFPNLHTVVLVGQSGGGQLALRYAFASRYEPPEGIQIRYIPMNPGAVVYVSEKRPVVDGNNVSFSEPDDERLDAAIAAAGTTDMTTADVRRVYNRWGWGLDRLDRYTYFGDDDASMLVDRFRRRPVAYLIGENDTGAFGDPPDFLAGPNRLERSRLFELHLRNEGAWDQHYHVRKVVPGVGHNGRATMSSDLGLWYIFGYEAQGSPSPEFDPGEHLLAEAMELLRRLEGRVLVESPDPGRGPDDRPRRTDAPSATVGAKMPLRRLRNLEVSSRNTEFARRTRRD